MNTSHTSDEIYSDTGPVGPPTSKLQLVHTECEGYERFPTFLIQTTEGKQKRDRLEDIKTRQPASVTGSSSSTPALQLTNPRSSDALSGALDTFTTLHSRMPSRINNDVAHDSQYISLFLERYLPSDVVSGTGGLRIFLRDAASLNDPGTALQIPLRALLTTHIGRTRGDEIFLRHGNLSYVHALQELRRALWDANSMWTDQTLAAGRVLVYHELFESTSTTALSSHETGTTRLIGLRGPEKYQSPIARTVLEDVRFSSPLSWDVRLGRIALGVCNHGQFSRDYSTKGFALAALLEEFDRPIVSEGNVRIECPKRFLRRCDILDNDLRNWYQELLESSPSPLYWIVSSGGSIVAIETQPQSSIDDVLKFPSLQLAHTVMTYWALRIILSQTVATICNNTTTLFEQIPPHLSQIGLQTVSETASLYPAAASFVERMTQIHSHAQRLEFTTSIVQTVPYCMNERMGVYGSQRCLFPLEAVLDAFEFEVNEMIERGRDLFQRLDREKGLRHAGNVIREMMDRVVKR
ncbi:hypothetical protein MMC13_005279 [Lambiella insularis]|nr:hypothetical protein [Lambiella insularis]